MESHEEESEISPYELLNVSIEATDQEIKQPTDRDSSKYTRTGTLTTPMLMCESYWNLEGHRAYEPLLLLSSLCTGI
jgi:hypothetical protein